MLRDNVISVTPVEIKQPWFAAMSRLLSLVSQRRWIVTLLLVEIGLIFAVAREVGRISDVSGGEGILDTETGYSHSHVVTLFDSYGEQGRAYYRNLQLWDLAHPVVYSLLLASLLFLVFRRTRWEWVALLPFAIGALDYIENALLWVIIATYPDIGATVVAIASVVSVIKFMSFFPVTIAVLAALAIAGRQRVRKRQAPTIATDTEVHS